MSRFRAAGIHFLLSIFVALCIFIFMLALWYPSAYFKLMGGGGLLLIMAGIDVCLGPLLTLVVFKSGKKTLKFDLAIIGILQFSALIYGASVMYAARPIFTVFAIDHFEVVAASDLDDSKLAKAKEPEWRSRSLTGPILVAALEPVNSNEKSEVELSSSLGLGLEWYPNLYTSYDSQRQHVLEKSKPLSELKHDSKQNAEDINNFLKNQSSEESELVFVPIHSSYHQMTAILDAKNADIVKIIDIDPH